MNFINAQLNQMDYNASVLRVLNLPIKYGGKKINMKSQTDNFTNTEINKERYGLIYIITNLTNQRYYIGKKCLHKGKAWELYWGSSKDLIADMKMMGKENFKKEILKICDSSYELSYHEIDQMVRYNWLSDKCYNQNMSGRYFKSKLKHTDEDRNNTI